MSESRNPPGAPAQIPGLPENTVFFDFAGWDGINAKPNRAGVDDNHAYWLDNIMPLGPNDLAPMGDRTVTNLYSTTGGLTIPWFGFFTLTATGPQCIVFRSDGSAGQVAVPSGTIVPIAPPGTFHPTVSTPFAFQFGPDYLIIVAEQENGYWLWDGTNLYGAGTLAPIVNITSGGQGYTTAPTVTVVVAGGGSMGATAHATIDGGSVDQVIIDNPGSGFVLNEGAILVFNGGGGGDTAYGLASVADGVITSIIIDNGGTGFTSIPNIVITDSSGPGTGAGAIVTSVSGGIITGIKILDGGHGYVAPVVATSGGGGSGLAARAFTSNGVVNGVAMVANGSGYSGVPTVSFSPGTPNSPGTGAAGTAIVLPDGTIGGVNVTTGGSGYSGTLFVTFTGGQGPASATVQLMPFGIQGSSGDENDGRVWVVSIVSPVKCVFSAPGTQAVQDFDVGDGAGAFPPTDSHLQYQWTAVKSSAGEFLYLLGDSSVDVESGANTQNGTTTFAKVNVDEQIGTIWRDSVINYGRAIMFANTFGIHTIYGGAVTKVSTPLDAVYSVVGDAVTPSSAVAEIYGVHVYLLLKTIFDPILGVARNALLLWDSKRWWTASQSTPLTQIAPREYASSLEAWGTDGSHIFQLFTTPSVLINKTLATKLWTKPTIAMLKKASVMYAFWEAGQSSGLAFTIVTEDGNFPVIQGPFNASPGLNWARSKTPPVVGHAMGYTMTTQTPNFRIVALTLMGQDYRLET